jgi:hypothetical protein
MIEEAGAVAGELELLTRPSEAGDGELGLMVRHARANWLASSTVRQTLILQRHLRDLHVSLLLPPLKVLLSLFARNRVLIVYFARLEIQREEAREPLDIG